MLFKLYDLIGPLAIYIVGILLALGAIAAALVWLAIWTLRP